VNVLGLAAGTWLTASRGRLKPGSLSRWIEVPVKQAVPLLQRTTRLVADLPTTGSRTVVWVSGADELQVATDKVTLACSPGLVMVTIPVDCDQLSGRVRRAVDVPLAVGTAEQPRGLMMATVTTPRGPDVVVELWADSLRAFAWESVLTLAREITKAAGHDREGRPLVPAAIGAEDGVLLIRPMAAHE
jgi:hypothetical protein